MSISLNNITSGYNIAKLNANFQKVQEQLNNHVLGTDGGGNTMNQDLDMNSNSLLNINVLDVTSLNINGVSVSTNPFGLSPNQVTDTQLGAITNSTKLSFLQKGVGAVLRTMIDKDSDFVSVKDFGAKGDGVTDDTNAFNLAYNSGATGAIIPAGIYIINGVVGSQTATAGFAWQGHCRPVLKMGVASGLSISGNSGSVTGIDFIAMAAAIPFCIQSGAANNGYGDISNNRFFTNNLTCYWSKVIDVYSFIYGRIENNHIGQGSGTTMWGTGITLSYSVNSLVVKNTLNNCFTSIVLTSTPPPGSTNACEGVLVGSNISLGCATHLDIQAGLYHTVANNVFDITRTGGRCMSLNGANLTITQNWLNIFDQPVLMKGTSSYGGDRSYFTNNVIGGAGTTTSLFFASAISFLQCKDNQFLGGGDAITYTSSTNGIITGNQLVNNNRPFNSSGTCTNTVYSNNNEYNNALASVFAGVGVYKPSRFLAGNMTLSTAGATTQTVNIPVDPGIFQIPPTTGLFTVDAGTTFQVSAQISAATTATNIVVTLHRGGAALPTGGIRLAYYVSA